jgi:hypothetical protein
MKKKVRKFASGGDILTAAGAVLLGKHLYDKYKEGKGKSDEDSDYARKAKEFRDKKNAEAAAVESKAEPKEEPKTVSAGEKRAMAASKGRPELIPEDADEATMRSDKYPSRKPVVTTTPKKAAPAAKKAPAASESSNTTPLTYYTPKPKRAEVSKPFPQAEATARLKKAEAERRVGQGLTPRAEYTGPGSRQHIEGLRLERSQRLEEEAKKQFEKNKRENEGMKRGGAVKKYASGGSVSSASKRADGIAQRGKTRGRVL